MRTRCEAAASAVAEGIMRRVVGLWWCGNNGRDRLGAGVSDEAGSGADTLFWIAVQYKRYGLRLANRSTTFEHKWAIAYF